MDPSAKGAWFKTAADVVNRCSDQGLLINGTQNVVLRLAPSVTISRTELDAGLSLLESVLKG